MARAGAAYNSSGPLKQPYSLKGTLLMITDTKVKSKVLYDRAAKKWLCVNGATTEFPAGPGGRQMAMLAALAHDHPALFEVVDGIARLHENDPQLVDRLIKACILLARGHVYRNGRVQSQTGDAVYTTTFGGIPKSYHCDCPAFATHAVVSTVYGPQCKHTLSQLIAHFAGLELPDEAITFNGEPR
jgi:hypothetical protein